MNGVREAVDNAVSNAGPERLHRVETVAKRFDVGRTTIYRLVGSGELRSIRVGGSRRIPESAITEYIERQRAR